MSTDLIEPPVIEKPAKNQAKKAKADVAASEAISEPSPLFNVGDTCLFWDEGPSGLMPFPGTILRVHHDGTYSANIHGEARLTYYATLQPVLEPTMYCLTRCE